MKLHSLIIVGFALMCSVSLAQPILTATGMNPVLGDDVSSYYNTVSTSPGNSGANQTWDLSAMPATTLYILTFVDPASTPYTSSYLNSNIALDNSTQNSVAYYNTSSSASQF